MSNEQLYYDTLRRIAKDYMTPEQMLRKSNAAYGLDFEETISMAYENIRQEAAAAIKGKRRPPTPTHQD